MTTASPYVTVTDLERQLMLRRIDCPRTISPARYRVAVQGAAIEIDAVEPRIHTGAAPIRAVQLHASGAAVSDLLRVEAELRTGARALAMETLDGNAFTVMFESSRATLFLYGTFCRDRDEPEIQIRVSLRDREISGIAIDRDREGRRALVLGELAFDEAHALVHAFVRDRTLTVDEVA